MRKVYLSLLAVFTSVLTMAQPVLFVNVPENAPTTTQLRAPNGLSSHTTLRAHFIIPASELTAIANGTVIDHLGFALADGVTVPAGGTIQIYLENTADVTNLKSTTWTTAIGTMTSVYNGAYSIPVSTTAVNADFTLSTSFTYTGGGIYVAYDYLGTSFDPIDPATYASNSDIPGATKMNSSATTTPPATLSMTSAFRPQMRFGYNNPYTNEVGVVSVLIDKGHPNILIDSQQDVSADIINMSAGDLTNIPVTLNITGANPTSVTQTIASLTAGSTTTLTFTGLSLANTGTQYVSVSVPTDDVNGNNDVTHEQIVSCDTLGYVTNEAPYTNIGYNTGEGILAVRQTTSAAVLTRIKGVSVYISEGTGNTLKGLLLDNNGTIVDSSAAVVLTAAQVGTNVYFPFIGNGNLPLNTDYYVGIRQYANATTGYFPIGTQEPQNIPSGRVFGFGTNGGISTIAEYTDLGNLMIKSVIEARFQSGSSPASGVICQGNPVSLLASAGYDNYEFFVDGSSVQNGSAASYNTTPASTIEYYVTGSYGSCSYTTATDSVEVVSTIMNMISDSFCAGGSYTFGSDVLTAAGTYSDTLVSSGGCDSVVVLTLTENMVNVTTTVSGETVTAAATGANYQWINCADNTPVNGATQQAFTPAVSGSYAVIVTENNCSDTSACQQVTLSGAGLSDIGAVYGLKLHPNPASESVHVSLEGILINEVILTDLNGKVLSQKAVGTSDALIDVTNFSPGVYLLIIRTDAGEMTRRIVKR